MLRECAMPNYVYKVFKGGRGRSAAGPTSLSSTLLRYYTASIVHILRIYIYILYSIYIYTYTWTYYCLYNIYIHAATI